MDVFTLREKVVADYSSYVRSFLTIKDDRIHRLVHEAMEGGLLWPEPLIQLNPCFEAGDSLQALVDQGELHSECLSIFRTKLDNGQIKAPFHLYCHQVEGIRAARAGDHYVLTTGTGSGKSLSYIVPIVDHVLRHGSGRGIQAIIVYPMNALANSQLGELEKFLCRGYPQGRPPVTFRRYTGQESGEDRNDIIASPPDILLTNYVMLELILTRLWERQLIGAAAGLRFLVLDELHTYRGRQGADVAMLMRRVRQTCRAKDVLYIGTSATLSSGGTFRRQQEEVAAVASQLFGVTVKPERVIGETLKRATPEYEDGDPAFIAALQARLADDRPPMDTAAFTADPLSSWIETNFGLRRDPVSQALIRRRPRPLSGQDGAARSLAQLTGVPEAQCERALRQALLRGYQCRDAHDRPIFAFRLHQFVSKGESVYASPEPESRRYATLQAQQFVPGEGRRRVLLPLAFCRECGQDYYVVRRARDTSGSVTFLSRELSDRFDNDDGDAGYLYISETPWPDNPVAQAERLPDAWLDNQDGVPAVRRNYRAYLPQKVFLSTAAEENRGNEVAWWVSAPFRFCLSCGVAYDAHQRSDFGKLATLGSEGRSTATTIMSLATVRELRRDRAVAASARKLLSFTDNRQDASLQAGHFNDFVEIALLRSGLWRAIQSADQAGLDHTTLIPALFSALSLPMQLYAADPGVKYAAREETERALREVLGYYIYRDLRRGWRITSPNLEQCGLLDIDYLSLSEFCQDHDEWRQCHPLLAHASAGDRENVCRVLLDYMRRELAIRVSSLEPIHQEAIRQLSRQRLVSPWALDDQERLERSRVVFPRSRGPAPRESAHFLYISPRGGFGLYLKRSGTFQDNRERISLEDIAVVIAELCEQLTVPGLLHRALDPQEPGDVAGYQLNAAALIWRPGRGDRGFHDQVRVPRAPEAGPRINPFFSDLYRSNTGDLQSLSAHEHTAQVESRLREEREDKFRKAAIPVLYCSPTMELGVDIAELSVVNMRNVPPTPANYAQRSGRAGRSGQPALVLTYCSAGSPHDQYFFKHPELMVAGMVSPPRLDLTNEDLLIAHVHAIWLSVSELSLKSSLKDVLDLSGHEPTLEVLPAVQADLRNPDYRRRARAAAKESLGAAIAELASPHRDPDAWLDSVLARIPASFERACERWRDLYRAALSQFKRQNSIIVDPSRHPADRKAAERLRDEAERQLRLLIESSESQPSDFYSYRYFACEGFLPGYNFPRLPLSAYLPGRRRQRDAQAFLTRPRFLAISEFGPRSFIYHEGSRYIINKVILPVDAADTSITRRAVQCTQCGYLHPLAAEPGPDLCESCRAPLPGPLTSLFRMQNVSTLRRDRISSDEEERFRLGYELKTGIRFAARDGAVSARHATLHDAAGQPLATLVYGHAATLWRMNLGWRRRRKRDEVGYILDVERGFWARNQELDDEPEDELSQRQIRVVPYVEDTRNCILIRPSERLSTEAMASLQAALSTAVQVLYQLEDRELINEALPGADDRRQLLLYEATEGGAGVLRRLVEEPDALPAVARLALELCHFDPQTGADQGSAPGAPEPCEAACYDCLLSYYNQRDHRLLDRHLLLRLLQTWSRAAAEAAPAPLARTDQKSRLIALCQTELERSFVNFLSDRGLFLPSDAQVLIPACKARVDFLYRTEYTAVFVDGPMHDTAEARAKDAAQDEALEDQGYTVIRFHHAADWPAIARRYPSIFGALSESGVPAAPAHAQAEPAVPAPHGSGAFDPDDFDRAWQPLMAALAATPGITVTPGTEVMQGGRVLDLDLATITRGGRALRLVDGESPGAKTVSAALTAQGERVLVLTARDPDAVARIIALLDQTSL